jgi:protein-S-isoprenylcysteine O-methyltransferase Ste14
MLPLCLTLALVARAHPDRRLAAGCFLASAWVLVSSFAVNLVAFELGWWRFDARGGVFWGVPVDLWLGWALFWGAVPLLAWPRAPLGLLVLALGWIDLVVMPASAPVVVLGPTWLVGEAASLLLCVVPAQLISRWTRDGRCLPARAAAQAAIFAALALWLLPSIVLDATGSGWSALLDRPGWLTGVLAQLLAVPAVVGTAALLEFVQRGRGTPFPWDPPTRLVTSGPYAYVANPMQAAMTLVMLGLGVLLASPLVACAGLVAGAFGSGFARWQEAGDLAERFGEDWRRYERAVRPWLPTWRPAALAPARLYVAGSCAACSEVGAWFAARRPVALEQCRAETYPGPLPTRLTYVAADGQLFVGVDALARALEHVSLPWAWLGWLLRLPVILQAIQLLADAVGAEPRVLERERTRA